MTLSIAWVRTLNTNVQELVFASDSRLSAGNRFDHATKLFVLPRSDCGLAFAGGTYWAYPMTIALANATAIHVPSATRALQLSAYLSHLVKILNQMQNSVHTYATGENIPDITILFGGWDWIHKRFRLWSVEFDQTEMKFISAERNGSNGFGGLGLIEFAGDKKFVMSARKRLKDIVQHKHGMAMRDNNARFDLEPFEVLRDILREVNPADSVGGAPQLMKAYQHMNVRHQGVYWTSTQGRDICYSGRPLLDYERADGLWVLDPDTLRAHSIHGERSTDVAELERDNVT
jgi:hypothetical protein